MIGKLLDEEAIFKIAAGISAPETRDDYLQQACGDDQALLQRVLILLRAHDESPSFLEAPPPGIAATSLAAPLAEKPGTLIGPYKLLEQIGEGGMGIVYMAQQMQPVKRKVALKVIKPGMDSKQVIARFEAERQALAMMDHPNIAKVLDAGTVGQASNLPELGQAGSLPHGGRPYFVMELVRGVPITEYCDKQRLNTRDRLKLFLDVCGAVQHAHLKGIVHRDLKPSNVLITLHDGTPVVKVIDFGVAKALNQELTERTLFTQFSQMVGTPLYMSPEQAELSGLDVDTRTDVYSLGVLLYELLTGTTPFDKERLKNAGFDEMRRIIREDEPETVSSRIAKTRRVGSAHHGSSESLAPSPQPLAPRLSEIDWIVMKALEKDRNRRYESASALAADIQRYLSDEPVLACPPTTMYRFQKFARKHQPALVTAVAIALCLLLGTTVSAWQAVRATTAEAQATANATEAQEKAKEATDQRDEAQRQRDEVKALADKLAAKEEELQRIVYADHIYMAKEAWDAGNVDRVKSLLSDHRPKSGEPDRRGFEWYYLNRLAHIGPLASVTTDALLLPDKFALSPDRTRLFAFDFGQTRIVNGERTRTGPQLRVWNLQTCQEERTAPLQRVESIANLPPLSPGVSFSPNATRMITNTRRWSSDKQAYVPGEVRVWDTKTGKEIFSQAGVIASTVFSPDSKLLAGTLEDHTVKIWDLQTGQERRSLSLSGHTDPAHTMAFSPDGKRLATGSNTWDPAKKASIAGDIKIWETHTSEVLLTLAEQDKWIYPIVFSPDGRLLASSAEGSGTISVRDSQTGVNLLNLKLEVKEIYDLTFSADGTRLIGYGYMYEQGEYVTRASMWNTETGQELLAFQRTALTFSPDGKHVVATDGDKRRTKVFHAQTGQQLMSIPEAGGKVAFSPDSKRMATQSGGMRIWDLEAGDEINHIKGFTGTFILAFSADGKRLIGSTQSTTQVWDVEVEQQSAQKLTIRAVSLQSATTRGSSPAMFSADFKRLAGISYETVKLFDAQTGHELRTLGGHGKKVLCVAISPDGKRVASGDGQLFATAGKPNPGVVKVWDADTGSELFTIANEPAIAHLRFSPDGKKLAGSSRDRRIKVWDAQTGRELLTLGPKTTQRSEMPASNIFCLFAFSPDGKRIAGPGEMSNQIGPDGKVVVTGYIWDAETGKELVTLKGARDCMAFSPDGKRVVGMRTPVQSGVFDAETGEPIFTDTASDRTFGNMEWFVFSPDSKRLVSATRILDAQTGKELLKFGGRGPSGQVAFSPDGHRLAIVNSGNGGQVTIYDATPLPEKP